MIGVVAVVWSFEVLDPSNVFEEYFILVTVMFGDILVTSVVVFVVALVVVKYNLVISSRGLTVNQYILNLINKLTHFNKQNLLNGQCSLISEQQLLLLWHSQSHEQPAPFDILPQLSWHVSSSLNNKIHTMTVMLI